MRTGGQEKERRDVHGQRTWGDGTESSTAEEHPRPAAWRMAASKTGRNTGQCLKNEVGGLRTILYLKWTEVLILVFVCHFGWGQDLRALLQHCYTQPITKKKRPRI